MLLQWLGGSTWLRFFFSFFFFFWFSVFHCFLDKTLCSLCRKSSVPGLAHPPKYHLGLRGGLSGLALWLTSSVGRLTSS
ncbi:hypothetical protein F4774DRAFT_137110 [Daldinia eschscholtzii]|nr:hypothetical protein F4774DRAFT_137110 [Daldinia eschscholtzii]